MSSAPVFCFVSPPSIVVLHLPHISIKELAPVRGGKEQHLEAESLILDLRPAYAVDSLLRVLSWGKTD